MANAVRNNVAACRLTDEQWQSITDKLKERKIQGAHTPGLLARKLLLDWDDGELVYKNKQRENTTRELFLAQAALMTPAPRNGAAKKPRARAKTSAPATVEG